MPKMDALCLSHTTTRTLHWGCWKILANNLRTGILTWKFIPWCGAETKSHFRLSSITPTQSMILNGTGEFNSRILMKTGTLLQRIQITCVILYRSLLETVILHCGLAVASTFLSAQL